MQKCCLLESGFVIEPVVLDTKCYQIPPGGEGTPHMKGVGMLVGNFELNPYRRPI